MMRGGANTLGACCSPWRCCSGLLEALCAPVHLRDTHQARLLHNMQEQNEGSLQASTTRQQAESAPLKAGHFSDCNESNV